MKKILSVLLAVLLLACLTACGGRIALLGDNGTGNLRRG